MNKYGDCPVCGKQIKPTNLRKIARKNQLYGFRMALDGVATTWGSLIQNLRCNADLTDEQVQKIIRIGDRYWEMVGQFKNEDMTPDEFADYITAKSEQVEKELRERWN
nr:MAG TPA: TRASH domain protein [Caudoviricetes sp.]